MKHLNLTILALLLSLASFAQVAPITGPSTICDGYTGTMSDATPGGTWTISPMTYAAIGPTTGVVTGIAPGVATVTYTLGTYTATHMVTIEALPGPISCPSSVCVGQVFTPTDPTPGGVWSTSTVTVLSISGTGIVIGAGAGIANLTYTTMMGCSNLTTITVNPVPAAITGSPVVCLGGTTTLSDISSGGIWISTTVPVAYIGSTTGIVSGVALGTANITYTLITGCFSSVIVTVTTTPSVYAVTGGGSFCSGGPGLAIGLSNSDLGVSYQLYNGGSPVGSPVAGTGTTLSFGTMTTAGTYTVVANAGTSCAATMSGSAVITVNPAPAIYILSGGGTVCSGGPGLSLVLSGSDIGVTYQLFVSGIAMGLAVTGTGAPITWPPTTMAGTYSVIATNTATSCTAAMGSATITTGTTPTVYSITGGGSYCSGGSGVHVNLSNSTVGVSYQLYNGGSPVGGALAGTAMMLDFGLETAVGTYTVVANPGTSCSTTMSGSVTVSISPFPTAYAVTGGGSYCTGGSGVAVGLSGSSSTDVYTLYNGGTFVSIISGTGSALSFGTISAAGTYTVMADEGSSCGTYMTGSAVVSITPIVVPAVSITATPGTIICPGAVVAFSANPTSGGVSPSYSWSVNGIFVGTGSSYSFPPGAGDLVGVTMTSSAFCASPTTVTSSVTMTVITPPTITATATPLFCGGGVDLTASGGVSYSWSPITGLLCPSCGYDTLYPSTTTTYTVTGTDGTGCTGTATLTVDGNSISGYISYTGTPSAGDFTIWLVQFNPIDSSILATDSTANCVYNGMPYYEFMDKPAGNYLVKAKLNSSIPGTTGYAPTYGLSSATWDMAATITHAASADSMHINMIYGTVPAGPGFVAGYVYAGAGKNTSGDAPAPNLTIYLINTAGQIVTYAITATDGSYTFSGIAEGSYYIYPESYKYYTTPSALVTLAPGSDTATAINFKQHNTLGTITPYDFTKVPQPVINTTGISIYPNPTTGNLNILWTNQATGNATISVSDMTGREVYTTSYRINASSGKTEIDLGSLENGIYLINIKSDKVLYSGKLARISN